MAGHTKGPWRVERGSFGVGRYIAGPDGTPICRIASNTTPKTMQRERDGVHEANARLIAAAPELYEALECEAALDMSVEQGYAVLERYGWDRDNRFDLPATEFVRRLRTAALAKARGESATGGME